jgi:uncharacterized protein (TIGR00297 family)
MLFQLGIGFGAACLIALLAWRLHALSISGAWAAILTGTLIFGLGGVPWAALLLVFFISSSALSRAFSRRKKAVNEKFAKGSQRDAGQVLANGGLGALLAIAQVLFPGSAWPWVAFVGAIAAVNADTWATELGVLNPSRPRLITTWRTVEAGTSGGVSLLGTGASIAGAGLIGLFAVFIMPQGGAPPANQIVLLGMVILGGLVGSLFDSLLGATVQGIYYCPNCAKETERHPRHTCGTETTRVRGWEWLDNDLVKFACSVGGAVVLLGLWLSL